MTTHDLGGKQPYSAAKSMGYVESGLKRETGWWGAFVIGLAGTILVTGIAPVMVTSLGAASIPVTVFITLTGWLLCLFLAELSAMMPERTGGSPTYAYPAYKDRWPRLAKHINGFTAWAYWLGWFPVAPLNMILASYYLADRFGINTTAGFTPIHTFIAWSTLVIAVIGILLFFIPAYRGIRFGAAFATVLALLSMIPLTFIAVAWIFNPSVVNFGELAGFKHLDGSSFFAGMSGYNWLQVYIAYGFLLTWNVIAMEAAACYIGECGNPDHDAKIAMNLEGGYGVFIYTLIPIAFIVVLGSHALSDTTLADPKTIFVTFAGKILPGIGGEVLNWIIAFMLIVALALSALNAIMGSGRALYQMALDGEFPTFFTKVNEHGVPARAMSLNVIVSLAGRPARRRGGDLQLLQCRLYRLLHPGADRLFPAAPGQARPAAALPPAGIHEIRRLAAGRGLFRLLALRRPLVFEDRQCRGLLLARLGDPPRLPALLLVPGLCRGQAQPGMTS